MRRVLVQAVAVLVSSAAIVTWGQPEIPQPQPVDSQRMIVKVYAVADLISLTQAGTLPQNPEVAEMTAALQQVVQVQAATQGLAGGVGAEEETIRKLERLKKAVRIAAPRHSWEGDGGGEIEVYAEGLSLIVRQTLDVHEAIADLLSQLRALQDLQIELQVELGSFEGVPDDALHKLLAGLSGEMTAEEAGQLRQNGLKTQGTSLVRMTNGRSAPAGGILSGSGLRFTAVANVERSTVEIRIDGYSEEGRFPSMSQSALVGKTVPFCVEGTVLLVTPKIVDRTPKPTSGK